LAKIAATSEAEERRLCARLLARGDGWSVSEVVCTLGPQDRPFEEHHSSVSIAIVAAGSFQYHSHVGRELMTPGSLMLGSAGQNFQCGHDHGTGDRCISFQYSREFFDRLQAAPVFQAQRVPPTRALSPIIARACGGLSGTEEAQWEEMSLELAAQTVQLDLGLATEPATAAPGSTARVARVVRRIECDPGGSCDVVALAHEARLSPYHFLRTFQSVTGVTPHQYLLRLRLQRAAMKLRNEPAKIVDIALECGFGDLSNFNRNFRTEFGVSPRVWRRTTRS
jgi:AraC family transcriptional regulator